MVVAVLTNWHIIETERHKEFLVRSILTGFGFTAWLPVTIKVIRPHGARQLATKSAITITKERPLIPGMLFAATGNALHGVSMRVRYVDSLWPLTCPDSELQAFRAEVDKMNELSFALDHKQTKELVIVVKSLADLGEGMREAAKRNMEEAA